MRRDDKFAAVILVTLGLLVGGSLIGAALSPQDDHYVWRDAAGETAAEINARLMPPTPPGWTDEEYAAALHRVQKANEAYEDGQRIHRLLKKWDDQ